MGCSAQTAATGYQVLRDDDLPLLRALIPVVLAGTQATETPVMRSLDNGPLTGVWVSWGQAGATQVTAFLQRWQDSSLNLLRMGHASLLQLLQMAWYECPESWADCGYPGPPKI